MCNHLPNMAGENICYEVMDVCVGAMRGGAGGGGSLAHVYRARFSAIGAADLLRACVEITVHL